MQIIIICYLRWLVCGKIRTEATSTTEKKIKQKKGEEDKIKRKPTEAN